MSTKTTFLAMLTAGLTGLILLGTTGVSSAAVIDFTGGKVKECNRTKEGEIYNCSYLGMTNRNQTFSLVDIDPDPNIQKDLYYEEDGFRFYFSRGQGGSLGNFYGVDENHEYGDVLHAYGTAIGDASNISMIKVTRPGGLFNLNSFDLISHTIVAHPGVDPGAIVHYQDKNNNYISEKLWLEPDGFGGRKIPLSGKFKEIDTLYFEIGRGVNSFSIDNLDLEPIPVPEPGTLWLLGGTLAGLAMTAKQRKTF